MWECTIYIEQCLSKHNKSRKRKYKILRRQNLIITCEETTKTIYTYTSILLKSVYCFCIGYAFCVERYFDFTWQGILIKGKKNKRINEKNKKTTLNRAKKLSFLCLERSCTLRSYTFTGYKRIHTTIWECWTKLWNTQNRYQCSIS